MNNNKNLVGQVTDQIFAKEQKSTVSKIKPESGPSNRELELALTVMLVDLASCDQKFEQREYQLIFSGLHKIFGTKKEEVQALVNQANILLANLRGVGQFAKILKENLDEEKRKAVLEVIDEMIHADGVEDGFEIYLRHKAATLLGLPNDTSK